MAKKKKNDFQKWLLEVTKRLRPDENEALAFLCIDLLGRTVLQSQSPIDLWDPLLDQGLLSASQPQLVAELLTIISRVPLLRDFGLTCEVTEGLISLYRKRLYELSREITKEHLKYIKFLLRDQHPVLKLGENVTTLGLFRELEDNKLLSETELQTLKELLDSVCPVLSEKVDRYKEQYVGGGAFGPSSAQGNMASSKTWTPETTKTKRDAPSSYPMNGSQESFCTIINNYDFTQSAIEMTNREGTMKDEKNLRDVTEWIGFEVEPHRDCKAEQMKSVLRELSQRDHSQRDCLMCCILSHGKEGGVYGVDGVLVQLEEIMSFFDERNCPSLAGKPKIFIIQACREKVGKRSVYVQTDSGALNPDAAGESIKVDADFLLAMSTGPSSVSYRDEVEGSWFIQSLCQNLVDMVPSGRDFLSILTNVNADVSQKTDSTGQKKQIPLPSFSLRKMLVFPAPSSPPPSLTNNNTPATESEGGATRRAKPGVHIQ